MISEYTNRLLSDLGRYVLSNRLFLAGILLSLIASLTPYYGVGYALLIICFATKLNVLEAFKSYFSNAVIAAILLMSSIMAVGVFTSILNIQTQNVAIINLLAALVSCSIICFFQPRIKSRRKLFDVSDLNSAVIGIVIPIVILILQFGFSSPGNALLKISNGDGWDNISHINILQVVSENNSYFYSTSPVETKEGEMFNNYPQGWHLATSSLMNSVAPGIFNPATNGVYSVLGAYIFAVFSWFALATFVFAKVAWNLLPRLVDKRRRWLRYLSFNIVLLLPIFTLFMSTIPTGYVNYLGLIPFVILVVASSIQILKSRDKSEVPVYLVFSLPLIVAVGLIWVLPTPPLLLLLLLVILVVGFVPKVLLRKPLILVSLLAAFITLACYLYILVQDISFDQIYVSSSWIGSLPSVTLVMVCLVILAIHSIRATKGYSNLILVLSPFLVYIAILWGLAYLYGGGLGYYHAKLFGVFFAVVALFTCSIIIRFIESLDLTKGVVVSTCLGVIMSLAIVSAVPIIAGQHVELRSFQRSQYYLTPKERDYVSQWIGSEESLNQGGQLLLMRKDIMDNRNKAMLFNRLSMSSAEQFLATASPGSTDSVEDRYTCLMYIYYEKRDGKLITVKSEDGILKNLSDCLKERLDGNLPTTIRLPFDIKERVERAGTYGAYLEFYGDRRR